MNELKIHSGACNDYLKVLVKKYESLKNTIRLNPGLTIKEKKAEIKKIESQFSKDRKGATQKLF